MPSRSPRALRRAQQRSLLWERGPTVPTTKASTVFTPQSLWMRGDTVVWSDYAGGGVNPQGAYGNSWVAYACIRRQAHDAASIPLVALSNPEDPDSLLPPSHPVQRLLARRYDPFDRRELVQWLVTWALLRGEFFIDFDDPARPERLIEWRDPQDWKHEAQGEQLIRWTYRSGGTTFTRLPRQIVHHKLINPADPFRGQSPLQAAGRAHAIETGGDELQRSVLRRGGERAMMFEAPLNTTDPQAQMLLAQVRARRSAQYEVPRDVLLPNGVKAVDPSFTEDDLRVLEYQGPAADKICAVYGMSRSLLGIEDIDKYATFQGRKRIYIEQQLMPLLKGIESALDRYFADEQVSSNRAFLRFDTRKVSALHDQDSDKFTTAVNAHNGGLPWSVLNERFDLGLDVDEIPGADEVLVPATMAPLRLLVEEWENPPEPAPDAPAAPGPAASQAPAGRDQDDEDEDDQGEQKGKALTPGSAKLTNALILKRALDPRRQIQRTRLLIGLERELRTAWHKHAGNYQRKLTAAAASAPADKTQQEAALRKALAGFGDKAADLCAPIHRRAAAEGVLAIAELLEDKVTHEDRDLWRKAWTPRGEVVNWINARRNLVKDMETRLFADVLRLVEKAVDEGADSSQIATVVRSRMQVSVNRAAMIGRTETGSAYNTARFVEMRAQEFQEHIWLTAADELVRDGSGPGEANHASSNNEVRKIGETFPCGLTHPMQDGADAANVINCRCETVPYVREAGR